MNAERTPLLAVPRSRLIYRSGEGNESTPLSSNGDADHAAMPEKQPDPHVLGHSRSLQNEAAPLPHETDEDAE